MVFSREVICKACGEKVSILGLRSHVMRHGLDYKEYKEKHVYIYEPCLVCGTPVRLPRKWCSIKCANAQRNYYRSQSVLSESTEKEIVDYYNSGMSKEAVRKKFRISVGSITQCLKKYDVKPHSLNENRAVNNKDRAVVFLESDFGKQLISEYANVGVSLKSLEKKYGISKRSLRRAFSLKGIEIRSKEESLKQIRAQKIALGIRGHNFGKTPPVGSGKCSWYLFEGIKYQGSWEFKAGLWLRKNNVLFLSHCGYRGFEYEKNGVTHTYLPDFYVPNENHYIEVKGYFSKEDQEKINCVKAKYPDLKIKIFDKDILKNENILSIDKELGICIEKYRINNKTGGYFMDELKESVSPQDLARQNIVEGKSLSALAKKYDSPYLIFCQYYYSVVPKPGTEEFYSFLFNHFFTPDQRLIIYKSSTIVEAARDIHNGLSLKRNKAVIQRVKREVICP
jgi:Mor family transcriptional regulator